MESYKPSAAEEKLATEEELHALRESYKKDQEERIARLTQEKGLGDTNIEITYPKSPYRDWGREEIKGILDGKDIKLECSIPPKGTIGGGYSGSIDGKPLSRQAAEELFFEIKLNALARDFSEEAFGNYVKYQREGRQIEHEAEQKRQADTLAGGIIDKLRPKYFSPEEEVELDRAAEIDRELES